MSYLSLDAVSAGIFSALNVSDLLALAAGGVGDHIDQRVRNADGTFNTFVLYELFEDASTPGLGAKPGRRSVLKLDLRVHVFWAGESLVPGQAVMGKVIGLLSADNAISISGYAVCGTEPFYDGSQPVGPQIVAGLEVNELVSLWRLTVQEAA